MSGSVRIVLAVVLVLGAVGVVAGTIVWPARKAMAADRHAMAERQAQLVKLQKVAEHITDLQAEIERLERALAFFENRLPEEREVDVILREVWLIAEAKALAARSIRTQKQQEMARCLSQPIQLSLEGPFAGFYEFLLGLERMPRITKLREMQVQRSPVEPGTVQADLLVDIFFEK